MQTEDFLRGEAEVGQVLERRYLYWMILLADSRWLEDLLGHCRLLDGTKDLLDETKDLLGGTKDLLGGTKGL